MSLLNRIKYFFRTSDPKAEWERPADFGIYYNGVKDMGVINSEVGFARIEPSINGAAWLTNARTGEVIAMYSRERDARRGALRRGLSIVA